MRYFSMGKDPFPCSPVQGGATMSGQVPLQLGQCGEVQTTLHAYILLAFFMLHLVGTKLTGVSEASAAHTAAERGRKRIAKWD